MLHCPTLLLVLECSTTAATNNISNAVVQYSHDCSQRVAGESTLAATTLVIRLVPASVRACMRVSSPDDA